MDICGDFIQLLGRDISIKILMHLDNPADLVRVCLVSSSWREFVIANDLCKDLCLKLLPQISGVVHTIEVKSLIDSVKLKQHDPSELECLRRNHRVYAFLARALNPFIRRDCISEAISASSTDNFPEESIQNTLEPLDRIENKASYWSSKGQNDPTVPETLIYKLMTKMCLVTEIHIQPFQAYFQYGFPIYSSKAVRFRMGHPRLLEDLQSDIADSPTSSHDELADDKIVWTYISPEFPVAQENCLQKFKLPEPVLCIGGFLRVELLGRVQRQEMDGLYYICISHVQVVGRPLLPRFDIEILDATGSYTLKYLPETENCMLPTESPKENNGACSHFRTFTARLIQRGTRGWEQVRLNALLRARATGANDEDNEPPASP